MDVLAAIGLLALALGLIALFAYVYLSGAERGLARAFEGLAVHTEPRHGDVELKYETYHGFVAWVSCTRVHVWMPSDEARVLLRRLLRFNFTWGLLAAGAALLPLLSLGNYWAQSHCIRKQVATMGDGKPV